VFRHNPDIRDLLGTRYHLGVTYLKVCTHNQGAARRKGWRPIRGADFYTIVGTKGQADMAFMGKGKPIPGSNPEQGVPKMFEDAEITRLTGHETRPEFTIDFREDSHGTVDESPAEGAGLPEPDFGEQDQGFPSISVEQDRKGAAGGSQPDKGAGSGKSQRHSQKPKG
jgi:hypothetical protein